MLVADQRIARLDISNHALREEGDAGPPDYLGGNGNFYPRPPRGGRLVRRSTAVVADVFLSTPSARRATAKTEKNISAFVSL